MAKDRLFPDVFFLIHSLLRLGIETRASGNRRARNIFLIFYSFRRSKTGAWNCATFCESFLSFINWYLDTGYIFEEGLFLWGWNSVSLFHRWIWISWKWFCWITFRVVKVSRFENRWVQGVLMVVRGLQICDAATQITRVYTSLSTAWFKGAQLCINDGDFFRTL